MAGFCTTRDRARTVRVGRALRWCNDRWTDARSARRLSTPRVIGAGRAAWSPALADGRGTPAMADPGRRRPGGGWGFARGVQVSSLARSHRRAPAPQVLRTAPGL